MRVGVFLSELEPERGGASTYQSTVFTSLLRYGEKSGHTFVIFSHTPYWSLSGKFSHIEFKSLHRIFWRKAKMKLLQVWLNFYCGLIGKEKRNLKKEWEEKKIRESNIELMWHPTNELITQEIPYITTIWDLAHRISPYLPEVSINGMWDRRECYYKTLLGRAYKIITGTKVGKSEIEKFYHIPGRNIKVIPFPTPAKTVEISKEYKSGKGLLSRFKLPNNYLFYPAQFWPHKNHVGILHGLKKLKDDYHLELPMVFVGSDKGNLSFINNIVQELDLTRQIHMLGFVTEQEVIALYHNALALVFLSLFGPDNLPPLEAFALGCPVIASNVPGAREQLGDAALLIDPCDEKAVALAIKQFYDSPKLRNEYVEKGYQRATQWTGENYIQEIFSTINDFKNVRRCWGHQLTL